MGQRLHLIIIVLLAEVICFGMLFNGKAVSSSNSEDAAAATRYWEDTLPGTQLPATLYALVSPLMTNSSWATVTATEYSCKAAGILCHSNAYTVLPDDDHDFPRWIPTSKPMRGTVQFERTPDGKPTNVRKHADFFREDQLVMGARLLLGHERDATPDRAFLPLSLARSIAPLITPARLPELLHKLSIATDSKLAEKMAITATGCSLPAMKGETRKCMTSMEELADFVKAQLQPTTSNGDLQVLTVGPATAATLMLEKSKGLLPATITQVTQLVSGASIPTVVCHSEIFSSALYACHAAANKHIYTVTLQAESMDKSASRKLVAICHQDTSQWTPLHVAFYDLGVKPGETEACHWIHERDVVFLPNAYYSSYLL